MSGAKIRTFVLTEEKFERNYRLLRDGMKRPNRKPNKHCTDWRVPPNPRFATFYLALWEIGRRPREVSTYTWEQVQTVEIDGRTVHFFAVSPEQAKTDEFDNVVVSDRLWHEMNQQAWRTGLVFRNSDGGQWLYWSQHHSNLKKAFGADCGWIRDTRRGFVTHKTEVLGMDARHVRMQSGHRTQSVFDRYRIGQLRNQARVVQVERVAEVVDMRCA